MNISIIGGCGYVGLITGMGFAALGHKVVGVDVDKARVDLHQNGVTHIYEEGLQEELKRLLKDNRSWSGSG
jgi:UDPglucose 6-dehydrogenase